MDMQLRSEGFRITGALDEYVRLRIRHALGRFQEWVEHVAVSMRDDNGPRGGIDKRVQVRIGLRGLQPVMIEERDSDLYMAIGRSSLRAERQVARSLERRRALRWR